MTKRKSKITGILLVKLTLQQNGYYTKTDEEMVCVDELKNGVEIALDNNGNKLGIIAYEMDGNMWMVKELNG